MLSLVDMLWRPPLPVLLVLIIFLPIHMLLPQLFLEPFPNGSFLHLSLSQFKIGIRQDGSRQKWRPQPRQVNIISDLVWLFSWQNTFSPLHLQRLVSACKLGFASAAARRHWGGRICNGEYCNASHDDLSQVISGHKFGRWRWEYTRQVVLCGRHGERYWSRYGKRYATAVPIVPYSCDPLQGSGPTSLSKRPE